MEVKAGVPDRFLRKLAIKYEKKSKAHRAVRR
jgi:hypothetical protein